MENLKTKTILETAIKLVSGQRHTDYGDKVENHKNIASLWSAFLDKTITPHDVAIMMCLLKIARTKLGAISEDTYVDMSAYSAIAGEIKSKEPKEESEGERRGKETWEHVKKYNKELENRENKNV